MVLRQVAAAFVFAWTCIGGAAVAATVAPTPVDAKVAGLSQAELTRLWWQWAGSFESADSPIADRTGAQCGAGQDGPVWFLAGVYGSAQVNRTCHVPAGKALFFPMVNYVVMPSDPCGQCAPLTCEQAQRTAHRMTQDPMGLFAELDGRSFGRLDEHRVATEGCFDLAARAENAPKMEPSASDGYWLALPPLAKGKHTLRFGGSLPSLRQDLVYTLIVE